MTATRTADVRFMLSRLVYAYFINQLPAERVAEEVILLNTKLAQAMCETGVTFTLDDLNLRFRALLRTMKDSGVCSRGEPLPTIITEEQWLQAQLAPIQKLAKGKKL